MTAPQRDMSLWRGAGVAHKNRSKALRDAAYRDPNATCWLCGKTLAEGPRYRADALRRGMQIMCYPAIPGHRCGWLIACAMSDGEDANGTSRGHRMPERVGARSFFCLPCCRDSVPLAFL